MSRINLKQRVLFTVFTLGVLLRGTKTAESIYSQYCIPFSLIFIIILPQSLGYELESIVLSFHNTYHKR